MLEAEMAAREDHATDPDALRQRGNAALNTGDADGAIELYTRALDALGETQGVCSCPFISLQLSCNATRLLDARSLGACSDAAAKLYANRAQAQLRRRCWEHALSDSKAALRLQPGNAKAWHRLALAHLHMQHFADAARAGRAGQRVLDASNDRGPTFRELLDQVSITAALHGDMAAFNGRTLHVRSAGEDAWMCQIAPPSPEDEDGTLLLSHQPESVLAGKDLGVWAGTAAFSPDGALQVARAEAAALLARRRAEGAKPLSFRCVQDAMAAAHDGDRIVLLAGHHNAAGTPICVNKRVLICGTGAFGDVTMEQRSNCPLMRITSAAVIQNLSMELCGFRECLLFEGDARNTALMQDCSVRCSGSHAIVVAGATQPTLRRLDVSAQAAGMLTLERSSPSVLNCTFKECGAQGIRACDASTPKLKACMISKAKAEGVVVMDQAAVHLTQCRITFNAGPGIDVSAAGAVTCVQSHIISNAGGAFLWDAGTAQLEDCHIDGGPHHSLLADGASTCVHAKACVIIGDVLGTRPESIASVTSEMRGNTRRRAMSATLPPEEGPFKFEADRYTRKQ